MMVALRWRLARAMVRFMIANASRLTGSEFSLAIPDAMRDLALKRRLSLKADSGAGHA